MAERITCPYCRLKHLPRHLCDPAKAVLDAMVARGESFTMPTVAFDEPGPRPGIGAPGDQLLRQLVVQAAVMVNRAAGRDLPQVPDRLGRYVCDVDARGRLVIAEAVAADA